MTFPFRRLAAAVALIAFVLAFAADALAQAGSRVAGIKFEGSRTLDAEVLRQSLRTKVGSFLDESLLNEDVKTLYQYFATVKIGREQVGDQVTITFVVTENKFASEVRLVGVDELSESDVRAVMDTTRGRPVADFRLENDARRIERYYRLKGYHFVQVTPSVADTTEGQVVTFTVLEGPHVTVDTITFKGNDHIPRSRLLESMATQESGFLGLRSADYVEDTLVKDRALLVAVYRSEGYLDATVQIEERRFSDDKSEVYLTIAIREGPAYTVGVVNITGAASFPGGEEALRALLRLEAGKRYRNEDLRRSIDAIQSAYHEEGFYSVNVIPDERPADGVVNLTLAVDEQSKVRVRNLSILGNTVTQDKVIRREISVFPGEVLNQNEIDKSRRRLQSLGYFTRVNTQVVPPADGDDPNQRDVKVEVDDDAKTGQVRFAVGASSDLGLLASFSVTKRNFDWRDWPERFGDVFAGRAFTGAGQTFQLELSPGTQFSSYRLAFTEPWLFDRPLSFGWDLFLTKFTRFDYDVDRAGLDLTLGRRFTFEGRKFDTVVGASGTTRIERVEISNLHEDSSPTAWLAQGRNSLLSERFAFRIDRVDSTLNPTEGWFAQYSPEIGFGGDIRLFKNEIELRRFIVLGKTEDERLHTLQIGGRVGYVTPLGSSVEADPSLFDTAFVPTYERFFAGGTMDYQVRGFAFGGAGPHGQGNPFLARRPGESDAERDVRLGNTALSVLDNHGDPLGGDIALAATAQYGFPLYEDLLGGVIFLDAGMMRDSTGSAHGMERSQFEKVRSDLLAGGPKQRELGRLLEFDDGGSFWDDIRMSVGFGFRIKIPIFGSTPIALDFGFPIRKRDGDDTQVLSFSIARDF
jgi:outer membrane protein insertion porin family